MKGPILLKEKQVKILLLLKNTQQPWHITTLASASGTTYVHTHNFLKTCASLGIASIEKHGKIKEIKLTEKGALLADTLATVYATITPPPKTPEQKPEEKKEEKK